MKKFFAYLLALCMVLGMLPATALATEGDTGTESSVTVVLPDGITEASFTDGNTVTDGTNYYATMTAALTGIHGTDNAVLYCKPGADVGSMTHGHVCKNLTVHGNGAYISGGEQDFELDNPTASGNSCTGLTGDVTLTVNYLNGASVWFTKTSAYDFDLVFVGCQDMGKVWSYRTHEDAMVDITLTNCTFDGTQYDPSTCTVYSNSDGAITLTGVSFSGVKKALNLNHKATGTQTVTLTGCTFTNVGSNVTAGTDEIPVRVLSSVEGGKSVLTVSGCTFTGTPEGGADILLDYGVGETTAAVSGTAANVVVEKTENVATTTAVTAEETMSFCNIDYVAQIVGGNKYPTLAAAIDAAQPGATVTLLKDVTLTETLTIPADATVTLDLNGKTLSGVSSEAASSAVITNRGDLTIKDSTATTDAEGNYISGKLTTEPVNPDLSDVPGYANNTITNCGKLTVTSGTIFNGGDGDACYPIDNNSTSADAVVIIDGGVVEADGAYAIRQFANSGTYRNDVTINDGELSGYRAVWVQLPGNNASVKPPVSLTVKGGTLTSTDTVYTSAVFVRTYGNGYDNTAVTITGGTFNGAVALSGPSTYTGSPVETVSVTGGIFNGTNGATSGETRSIYTYSEHLTGFITGGTFASDPSTYLAEGYKATEGGNGWVVEENFEAQIGETKYPTLAAAIAAAQPGQTVTLLQDMTLTLSGSDVAFTVEADDNIILDLNGKTISATGDNASGSCHILVNKGTLTIKDSGTTGAIKMSCGNDWSDWVQATPISNRGTMTVESGTISVTRTNNAMSYAIDTNSGTGNATTIINGGTIYSDYCALRIFNNSANYAGTVEITGGEVKSVNRPIFLQTLNNDGGKFTVTGGTIISTGSNIVYLWGDSGEVTISGGTFTWDTTTKSDFVTLSETEDQGVAISGGSFEGDPTSYLADGYSAALSDGKYIVGPAVTGVTLSESSKSLTTGGSFTLIATVEPSDAADKSVTWNSDNESVATVADGVVTAVAAGTANITVTTTDGEFFATCEVTVTDPTVSVTGVTLDKATLSLTTGYTGTLTATVAPANATNKAVTWTSSNTSVATVSNGTVTAVSAGTATITVTTADGSFTATCTVSVSDPYIPPTYYEPVVPVTPPTTTEKTENEDGSTTTTVTDNKTGTVTETTENTDGSTTTVETQKDGTVTETVENTDGSTQVTETKAETTVKEDGTTETKTESTTTATDAAGNVTTSTTTATETTTVTDEGATVTEKVEETKSESAEATVETKTTATTTATEEKTETVAVTEETVTKADGTTETKTTTTTETALADGTTGTATTDESGKTEAAVTISEEAAASEEPVALPIPAVTASTESEAASTITVTTNSEETTTVAIPVADVSSSTVAVIVNEDGTETVISETKMTEEGLVVDVPNGATVKIVDNSTDFYDVEDHHWENDAVDFASARGLVNGVGGNAFDKDGITTRAHVVTVLARLAGVDTTPDEGEKWYDKGHEWAVENGITYAGNMNGAITRHEMMTLLWRFVGAPKSDHDISHFTDIDGLTAVTEPAARWAVEIGLVQGHGDNTMTPTANVTRGQLAQFLMNFIQKT